MSCRVPRLLVWLAVRVAQSGSFEVENQTVLALEGTSEELTGKPSVRQRGRCGPASWRADAKYCVLDIVQCSVQVLV